MYNKIIWKGGGRIENCFYNNIFKEERLIEMKYDYLVKKDDMLVKFDSKKDIINWVKENEKKINNNLELVRRVKKVDKIVVDDLVEWVKNGDYKLIDEEKKEERKRIIIEKRNNEVKNLLG